MTIDKFATLAFFIGAIVGGLTLVICIKYTYWTYIVITAPLNFIILYTISKVKIKKEK